MTFWILAACVAVATAAAILYALARGTRTAGARPDLAVYRDQLAEVDRDLARGVLDGAEAERARTEVARRLLAADRTVGGAAVSAPRGLTRGAMGLVAVSLIAGAGLVYFDLGAPGYVDQPLAKRIERSEALRQSRPSQQEAEEAAAAAMPNLTDADPEFLELMRKLRGAVAERPNDLQGLLLLARNEAGLGNFAAAARAQERVLSLADTPPADAYADLVEYYLSATGGFVTPEADAAIAKALAIDSQNPRARYFAGYSYLQIGRADIAFRFWRPLLEEGPDDAPWIPPIRSEIGALARLAGDSDYTPPAPARGPSAADVAAASDMSEEDRTAMIRGMVDGLAARLAEEGGPADDWARLIGALGVLGETDRARAIWTEAQEVFGASPEALATLREAAASAGALGE